MCHLAPTLLTLYSGVAVLMKWLYLQRCFRRVAFAFFLLTVVSCGQAVRNTGSFESYVEAFEKDAATLNRGLTVNYIEIKFGELNDGTLALCSLGVGTPLITVNQSLWGNLDETQRQLVIYHELGHCVLKKGHANQEIRIPGQRIKLSIMNQHPLDLTDYLKFRKDYLNELFNSSAGRSI